MVREVTLNHICKIEGHANLSLKIKKGKVVLCELKAVEGARFFEALVLGKNMEDVQEVVSRICGICSSSHSTASVKGLEDALGATPTAQQKFIREILLLAERIRSHATHLYFMSLPDYLGVSSALNFSKKDKGKVDDALKIITMGNKLVEEFGGREIHPFLKVREDAPNVDFVDMLARLREVKPVVLKTIKLFSSFHYPALERECEYLSLQEKDCYASISGEIVSHNESFAKKDYKSHLSENIKEYATSKFVLHDGKPYLVGAMARINNNYKNLDVQTKDELFSVLKKIGIKLPFRNPYHNLICQSLEVLEAINRIIELLENPPVLGRGKLIKKGRRSLGVSAVEAPRGTLFHEYRIGKDGKVEYCNIITPTAQNLNMMEQDIVLLVDVLLGKNVSKKEIVDQVEKLIRAYDPCFSCSTHFLKVNWLD